MTGHMKTLGAGLLAGLVAALLMTLVMVVLRYTLGVASTFEMIGDRFAPLIPVEPFLELQATLGGYNAMKQLGVSSAIVGQLVEGSLGGAAYAIIIGRAGRSEAEGRRFGRPGVTFVAGAVGSRGSPSSRCCGRCSTPTSGGCRRERPVLSPPSVCSSPSPSSGWPSSSSTAT